MIDGIHTAISHKIPGTGSASTSNGFEIFVPTLLSNLDLFSFKADEQKAFQAQHGEKYIQLKAYADQLEVELSETKSKMQAITTSNDELREVSITLRLY